MFFGNTYSTEETVIIGYAHVEAELNYRYFHLQCQNEPSPKIYNSNNVLPQISNSIYITKSI